MRRVSVTEVRGAGSGSIRVWLSWLTILVAAVLGACGEPSLVNVDEAPRAPVEARASVDRAVATTGDVLTFRVTVDHDAQIEVDVPEIGAEIVGFRIVDTTRAEPVESEGRILNESVYSLRADLVGSYILPSITVSYRPLDAPDAPEAEVTGVVQTSEIFVEVESVLPSDGSAEDILDIKPLRPLAKGVPEWVFILGAAAALIAALLVWFWLRRRRDRPTAAPEPAHVMAFAALDRLRAIDFSDPVAVRRFYFEISEVLRGYIEGRFGLNATDLTSEEILRELPTVEALDGGLRDRLSGFLQHTDQVKFAEHRPSEVEVESTYEAALAFVEATVPAPAPEPQEELAA